MGGGKQPAAPAAPAAPPSVAETSAQAIQAQIDALPKILEAQKQYGGQFSELNLQELEKFGPQFAEAALKLQEEYGPRFAEIERALSPELAGAQDTLKNFFAQTDDSEYASLRPGMLEDVRSAQSQRGIGAISPLGSIDESVQLQRLKQSLKDRRLNVALSTAGRVPIGGMPTVQGQTGSSQAQIQNVNSASIFDYQSSLNNFNASIFGTQANIFGTQSQAATARRGQNVSMINAGIGQAGSLAETGAGMYLFCWVASELFGGWHHPKTESARNFIGNIGPRWFKNLYIKHGERFASWIKDKPWIKNLIRPVFEVFASIGSRGVVWG